MTAPIPRSPTLYFHEPSPPRPPSPTGDHMLDDEREYAYMKSVQQKHDDEERIPFPYCYTEIIMPEEDKIESRKKFVHEANMRRWQHIHQSKLPVKR